MKQHNHRLNNNMGYTSTSFPLSTIKEDREYIIHNHDDLEEHAHELSLKKGEREHADESH